MNEKISIIVPVYNVGQYLERCMTSILNQTYTNIEVILVDDGSTDNTPEICKKFEESDNRIRVISKNNGGVTSARIAGIEAATGELMGFVDGDDWINQDMYFKLSQELQGVDLAVSGLYREYETSSSTRTDLIEEGEYAGINQMQYIWKNMLMYGEKTQAGMMWILCNKLFRTDIVKELYKEVPWNLSMAEDMVFTHAYLLRCRAIHISHSPYYHYYLREGSAMNSFDERFLIKINELYLSLKSVYQQSEWYGELMYNLERYMVYSICQAVNSRMGFSDRVKLPWYRLPDFGLAVGTVVALYGAGEVGQDYYRQLSNNDSLRLAAWFDKDYLKFQGRGQDVRGVEQLTSIPFDYLIIAVKYKDAADGIRQELMQAGIAKDKILWAESKGLV